MGGPKQQLAEAMAPGGHLWIQTTVAKTEAAQRPIRVNELAALADVFGVNMSALVADLDESAGLRDFIEAQAAQRRALDEVVQCAQAVADAQQRLREAQDRSAVATATAEGLRLPVAEYIDMLEREARDSGQRREET